MLSCPSSYHDEKRGGRGKEEGGEEGEIWYEEIILVLSSLTLPSLLISLSLPNCGQIDIYTSLPLLTNCRQIYLYDSTWTVLVWGLTETKYGYLIEDIEP
jgi:hypothetical protein